MRIDGSRSRCLVSGVCILLVTKPQKVLPLRRPNDFDGKEKSPPEAPMARRTVLLLTGLFGTGAAIPPATTAPPAARGDLLGDPLPDGALARVGTLRFRHGAPIVSVAYAPDGKSVATGGRGRAVPVWGTAAGRQRPRSPPDGALPPPGRGTEDRTAPPDAATPGRR